MSTREFIKMQSINFCYMNFMLQVSNSDSVAIETESIKEIFVDGDTVSALMQDGEVIYAIDLVLDKCNRYYCMLSISSLRTCWTATVSKSQ